jgi:hypothetical protein
VLGDPSRLLMRVHDDLLNSVAFIVGTVDGNHRVLGTGFFLGLITPSPGGEDSHHYYFITAKHCLRDVTDVEIRLNKLEGGTGLIQIERPWFISETADVAAIHLAPPFRTFSYLPIDGGIALTDTRIVQYKIGIGDEVMTVGLLFQREGQHRNLPIVRTGIISAMPDEPIRDETIGAYSAYLVEARSTHGLSGSPVFVILEPGRVVPEKVTNINNPVAQAIAKHRITFLLGVVRGFYPASMEEIPFEITQEMLEAINTGITAVTPIQEAIGLLNRADVSSERNARDVERLSRRSRRIRGGLPRKKA